MISSEQQRTLIEAAIDARQLAYARYSNYQVGAAILCADGELITGCNVENASYGLTICAERVAVFTAVAAGQREFVALAIATKDAGAPCGACRQVLSEFARDLPILLVATDRPEKIEATTLDELLPMRFQFEDQAKKRSEDS